MPQDPIIREHQDWLGLLQPVGLVVSPTALKNAQARILRNPTREHETLINHTQQTIDDTGKTKHRLTDFQAFAQAFWSWEPTDLATPPDSLSTALQDYGEILRPTFAVPSPANSEPPTKSSSRNSPRT